MKVVVSLSLFLIVFYCSSSVAAQAPEVTITLNEQFFDGLLDAAFQNAAPPQFSLAKADAPRADLASVLPASYTSSAPCDESITVLRQNQKTRTGVRFRDGKIIAPLAFTGRYSPPLIGCRDFSGAAEATVTLEFDAASRILRGNAKVTNVSLDGTGGIGGGLIARMVQGTIDKKINPIQIIELDKLAVIVPIQNSARLAIKPVGMRSEVVGNALNVYVQFAFEGLK